jgi:predicted SnoaL-like aldol condensation-catalyzing enzyme
MMQRQSVALIVPKALLAIFLTGCAMETSPSGAQHCSMDLQLAEQNRALVLDFQEAFFNEHDLTAADRYLHEDYTQHNPTLPDGRAALVNAFRKHFDANPEAHSRVIRSAVQDDLVYVHIHSTIAPTDLGRAIVNIYRVVDGVITEHWDVIQSVPTQSSNDNGVF